MEQNIARELDQDIINEVGNIISNHGANAFSKMVKDSINIKTEIDFISIADFKMEFIFTKDFADLFRGITENLLEGFFLQTTKGAEGISVILFNEEHAEKLVGHLMGGSAAVDDIEKYKDEVLKEFSSIIINAYVTALSNMIESEIQATMPIPAKDILGALYEFREKLHERNKDEALLLKTDIVAESTGINGKLIILLEPESINKILETLKVRSGA